MWTDGTDKMKRCEGGLGRSEPNTARASRMAATGAGGECDRAERAPIMSNEATRDRAEAGTRSRLHRSW